MPISYLPHRNIFLPSVLGRAILSGRRRPSRRSRSNSRRKSRKSSRRSKRRGGARWTVGGHKIGCKCAVCKNMRRSHKKSRKSKGKRRSKAGKRRGGCCGSP